VTPQQRLAPYKLTDRVLLDGLEDDFATRLYGLLADPRLEHRVHIVSGFRTYAQQLDLYTRWKNGTYDVPSVAKPGTSRHETGRAADLGIGWGTSYGWSHVHLVSIDHGIHYPVRGEAWHAETRPGAAPVAAPIINVRKRTMFQWTQGGNNYLWDGEKVVALAGCNTASWQLAAMNLAPNIGELPLEEHNVLLRRLAGHDPVGSWDA
jgi:hypothetical protein